MAEAILRHKAGDRFEAASAGIESTGVHPLTTRVLEEAGYPTEGLHSKSLSDFLAKASVRVAIIVCEQAAARCPSIYPFAGQVLRWPCEDPALAEADRTDQLDRFRRVRDEIEARIDEWLEASEVRAMAPAR